MNARTNLPVSVVMIALLAACAGLPPASPSGSEPPPTSTQAPSATERTSLLPDGIWEAQLSTSELIAAGSPTGAADGGSYRWTFDGTRARIAKDDEWSCDGDASPDGDSVRIAWHCGGWDIIGWDIAADGLHLSLVTNGSSGEQEMRAWMEAKPYEPIDGDATLSWSDAWVTCGDPDAGACRGTLTAGTYTTEAFLPGLTYTIPDGWQNLSDIAGEVAFLAPGDSLDNVDAEGIVAFTSVRAENRLCRNQVEAEREAPGVGRTPEALAAEFQVRPGLQTTSPQPVTIGGLRGLVMDISMEPGWTGMCFYWPDPVVQLLAGVAPSDFEHPIIPGMTMRLFLLERGDSTVAVEIDDFADGAHLDAYTAIVEQFVFGS